MTDAPIKYCNSGVTENEIKYERQINTEANIATPPSEGTGTKCTFRSDGSSYSFFKLAILIITGIDKYEIANDKTRVSKIVLILMVSFPRVKLKLQNITSLTTHFINKFSTT